MSIGCHSRKRTSEEGVRPEWRHAVKARLNLDTWSYYLFDSADPKVPLSQSLRWHRSLPPTRDFAPGQMTGYFFPGFGV